MTGAPPVPDRTALWAALSQMRIPVPGTVAGFEESLAERQGWTVGFAERVFAEYRRFLYLAATSGSEVTPSRTVDEAWHLHLDCPHYREVLCGQILRRPLDHRPATGMPGEQQRHERQYEATVELYERAFLKPPPSDIWPSPRTSRESAAKSRRRRNAASTVAAGAAVAAAALFLIDLRLAALALAGVAIISALVSVHFHTGEARARSSAGCGGSCAGWHHYDGGERDSDGGAGCGGGCGGGD